MTERNFAMRRLETKKSRVLLRGSSVAPAPGQNLLRNLIAWGVPLGGSNAKHISGNLGDWVRSGSLVRATGGLVPVAFIPATLIPVAMIPVKFVRQPAPLRGA